MKRESKSSQSLRTKSRTRSRRSPNNMQQRKNNVRNRDTMSEFLQIWHMDKLPHHKRLPDSSARPISEARLRMLGAILSCCFLILMLRSAFIMLTPDEKLENQACCSEACYRCLKNFKNRSIHNNLNLRLGIDLLNIFQGKGLNFERNADLPRPISINEASIPFAFLSILAL